MKATAALYARDAGYGPRRAHVDIHAYITLPTFAADALKVSDRSSRPEDNLNFAQRRLFFEYIISTEFFSKTCFPAMSSQCITALAVGRSKNAQNV